MNRIRFAGEAKHATSKALGVKVDRFQRGGRVVEYRKMMAGAGSGEGRLDKIKLQKDSRK